MTSQKYPGCVPSLFATAFLLAAFAFTPAAQAQDLSNSSGSAAASKSTTFSFVQTPDITNAAALAADSENDIWAVPGFGKFALHFDGSKWNSVRLAQSGRMSGVAVLSPDDIWAVGEQLNRVHSLVQHFDGNKWSVVPSPQFTFGETLSAIGAISAQDIFAVGFANVDTLHNTIPLVEHFNGTTWSVVPTPKLSEGELRAVAIISPSDIWAVGGFFNTSHPALTMHFDGKEWKRVPAPGQQVGLVGVTAVSTDDVWAVGDQGGNFDALIEHFDGTSWKIVPGARIPPDPSLPSLNSISTISATDIWATGCSPCGDGGRGQAALVEHWDGKRWTINPTPRSLQIGDTGSSVLTFPSGDVFVGGISQTRTGPGAVSFILHGKEGK